MYNYRYRILRIETIFSAINYEKHYYVSLTWLV